MAPVRIASVQDIPPGSIAAFEVYGTPVVVANVDGNFYAINNICSHAHAELSDGELDAELCTLTCPIHGSAFDLRTGNPQTLPAFEPVARYPVTISGDDLLLDI